MIHDSNIGKTAGDRPANRAAVNAPLSFPSADGPGRPGAAAGPPESGSAPGVTHAWALTPALVGAMCAVALLSIALHDGLGLRSIEQSILVEQQERAERVLQTIEVRLRLDADNTQEVAALLARDATFLDALHSARAHEAALEQTLRQTSVDGIELVADASPVSRALDGGGAPAQSQAPGPEASIQRNRDGELVIRFVERVGPEHSGGGWLVVE